MLARTISHYGVFRYGRIAADRGVAEEQPISRGAGPRQGTERIRVIFRGAAALTAARLVAFEIVIKRYRRTGFPRMRGSRAIAFEGPAHGTLNRQPQRRHHHCSPPA